MVETKIKNRVANSGLKTLNLSDIYPDNKRIAFDIKPYLFHELILKEKNFRTQISALDKTIYQDAYVCVFCSVDTVIPYWAFMLVAKELAGIAKKVFYGNLDEMEKSIMQQAIDNIDIETYRDQRVVIKGCADEKITPFSYVAITEKLMPVVQSLMFGEPCSTVPIYKKKLR